MTTAAGIRWITSIINANLMPKSALAAALGVEPPSITQYLAGTIPRPRTLRGLLTIVRKRGDATSRALTEDWERIALRPLGETCPSTRSGAATLAHYVLEPLWEDHRLAVAGLPPDDQERILTAGIAAATQASLAGNERALAAAIPAHVARAAHAPLPTAPTGGTPPAPTPGDEVGRAYAQAYDVPPLPLRPWPCAVAHTELALG